MKHLIIIALLVIPTVSLAWKAPVLESICLGEKNAINITLGTESDYTIEFSGDNFTTITEVDFVHSGSHVMYLPITGTLYARYKSDHNAKTSVSVKDCTPPKEEKKKSSRRKHKHGYIRRPAVFASPMSAILPLFDLPLFDYPLPNIKG